MMIPTAAKLSKARPTVGLSAPMAWARFRWVPLVQPLGSGYPRSLRATLSCSSCTTGTGSDNSLTLTLGAALKLGPPAMVGRQGVASTLTESRLPTRDVGDPSSHPPEGKKRKPCGPLRASGDVPPQNGWMRGKVRAPGNSLQVRRDLPLGLGPAPRKVMIAIINRVQGAQPTLVSIIFRGNGDQPDRADTTWPSSRPTWTGNDPSIVEFRRVCPYTLRGPRRQPLHGGPHAGRAPSSKLRRPHRTRPTTSRERDRQCSRLGAEGVREGASRRACEDSGSAGHGGRWGFIPGMADACRSATSSMPPRSSFFTWNSWTTMTLRTSAGCGCYGEI